MYHAGANGGQRVNSVSASGSAGCQSACVNNPLCTGVDFHTMTSTCYLHGPWSGYHVHFMSGVVHYDYKCRGRGLHIHFVFSTLYIGLYNSLYRPTIDRPTTLQALIVNVKCLVVCWNCCCKLSHQHLTFKQARAVWSCLNVCVRACVCVCDKVHEGANTLNTYHFKNVYCGWQCADVLLSTRYDLVTDNLNWYLAQMYCQSIYRAKLVMIANTADQLRLQAYLETFEGQLLRCLVFFTNHAHATPSFRLIALYSYIRPKCNGQQAR